MENIWYFAYGSNLNAEKFTHSRGIIPLASLQVRIPGWQLSMSIPGLPFREPAFASLEPICTAAVEEKGLEVEGVAYLISRAQYIKIIASEGGGVAYREATFFAERSRKKGEVEIYGDRIMVRTLINAIFTTAPGRPSVRYMVFSSIAYLLRMLIYVGSDIVWREVGSTLTPISGIPAGDTNLCSTTWHTQPPRGNSISFHLGSDHGYHRDNRE